MSEKGGHIKKTKKKKTLRTVLIVILVLLLAALALGYAVFHHLYGLMNTSANSASATAAPVSSDVTPTPVPENVTPEPSATPEPTPEPLTEEELAALAEIELKASLQEDAEEIMYSDDVYNLLLLGADGRTERLERSDAMILLSINKTTKTIWLTSFMRDTQVTLPGYGTGHLNWATSWGGVDLLLAALESEKNFAIHIDNWALVDFLDFAEIAEMVGPITVTVTPAEAEDINIRIREVCRIYDAAHGIDPSDYEHTRTRCYFPEEGGTFTITDGIQILGYARERHIGGDTGRSQKQRDVLMQMWENVKKMSLREQYEVAKAVMSIISTDLTEGQCFSLLLEAPALMGYEIRAQQCPTPGAFWRGLDEQGTSIYNADFRVNRNFLRATIYNEDLPASDLTSDWTGVRVTVWDSQTDTVP